MDPKTSIMPLTFDLWMTQHGFTMNEGEKMWHDSKSEEVYVRVKMLVLVYAFRFVRAAYFLILCEF